VDLIVLEAHPGQHAVEGDAAKFIRGNSREGPECLGERRADAGDNGERFHLFCSRRQCVGHRLVCVFCVSYFVIRVETGRRRASSLRGPLQIFAPTISAGSSLECPLTPESGSTVSCTGGAIAGASRSLRRNTLPRK